jgi:hypothetical protein
VGLLKWPTPRGNARRPRRDRAVGPPRSQASRGCGRSLLPVEMGVYVVGEAGAVAVVPVNLSVVDVPSC